MKVLLLLVAILAVTIGAQFAAQYMGFGVDDVVRITSSNKSASGALMCDRLNGVVVQPDSQRFETLCLKREAFHFVKERQQ